MGKKSSWAGTRVGNKEGRLALSATQKTRRGAVAPSGPSTRANYALAQDDKAGPWIRGCKERGEWAELCFMAKAAGMGLSVSKPLGDSCRYDVLVESGERILRVQVKSTIYRRRGNEYSLNVMGPGRKRYKEGSVDFFAVYLIPEDEWYIIPYAALGKKLTLHFVPGGGRQKYLKYREAWNLLQAPMRKSIEIQACAELGEFIAVGGAVM